jgi:hypothetical protein
VFQLVLQFKPWGARHIDELVNLEDSLIEALAGVAEIDGHDLGSDEANIFILCSEPAGTVPRCVAAAHSAGLLPILSAGHRPVGGEGYTRVWPKNDPTVFEVT